MLVRIALFAVALWALEHALHGTPPRELIVHLRSYGWWHITMSLLGTMLSFLILGAIEMMAIRAVTPCDEDAVPNRVALATSFVATAFGQTIGISLLTGGAVRLRAYARHGMNASRVAGVTAFVTLTATLGLLATGGWALVQHAWPVHVGGIVVLSRPLGVAMLAVVGAYFVWSLASGRGRTLPSRWTLARVTPGRAAAQLVLSCADWLVTGALLSVFVPATLGLSFWVVVRASLIAQTVAVASHVPGGAGVFEVVLLTLLLPGRPSSASAALLAAVVMYRVVYYLVPLCVAIAVAGVAELRQMRRDASDVAPTAAPARSVATVLQHGR